MSGVGEPLAKAATGLCKHRFNQSVPCDNFHKIVDLHEFLMMSHESIVNPNVEHNILSSSSALWLLCWPNSVGVCQRPKRVMSGLFDVPIQLRPPCDFQPLFSRIAAQAMDRHTIPTTNPAASVTVWSKWSSSKSQASDFTWQETVKETVKSQTYQTFSWLLFLPLGHPSEFDVLKCKCLDCHDVSIWSFFSNEHLWTAKIKALARNRTNTTDSD